MTNQTLKYAISLGEEWFTGFHFTGSIGNRAPVVGKSLVCLMLVDEDGLKNTLRDLRACDYVGEVYEVELRKREVTA